MEKYTCWTGTYEFKSDLMQILLTIKEHIEFLICKINETDKKVG